MSTQPNQGKNSDQDRYSGYSGYQPRKPADDPYGAYYQPSGKQQNSTAGTAGAGNQQSDPNYVYGQQQQEQTYRASSASSGQQQQQSSTYQPPSSVAGKSSYSSSSQRPKRLSPNQAAALSYLGIWITGLFFFFWERKNRLVRFSAAQSVVLFFPLLIIYGILQAIIGWITALGVGNVFGLILGPVAFLLNAAVLVLIVLPGFVLWLFLMFQAYRGREVKLPYVGNYAEKMLSLFSPKQKKGGS